MPTPFVWTEWPSLRRRIRQAGQLALFLDYDGTLTAIADHPDKARLSGPLKKCLRELSGRSGIWVALVSGRGLRDLKKKVSIPGLCYVGNHGLEVQGPKFRHIHPAAQKSRPVLRRICRLLKKTFQPLPGVWVEDKGRTLSVHHRQASERDRLQAQALFHQVLAPYRLKRQVRVTFGKMVFEVRPPVHWTKGTVVAWLLARQTALSRGQKVLPIYVGDDLTDEDAFKALRGRGITINVGTSNPLTLAKYRVRSTEEVERLLNEILNARPKKAA